MEKQQRQAGWGSWSEKQNGEAGVRSRMGKLFELEGKRTRFSFTDRLERVKDNMLRD